MRKLFIITIGVLLSTSMVSQNFEYLYDTEIENKSIEVIEQDNGFLISGYEAKRPNRIPFLMSLSKEGTLINYQSDTSYKEVFNYLLKDNNVVYLIQNNYSNWVDWKIKVSDLEGNEVIKEYFISDTVKYDLYNSRLLEDSILAITAVIQNGNTGERDAAVYFLNLSNPSKDTLLNLGFKGEYFDIATDIFYMGEKYYVVKAKDTSTVVPDGCYARTEILRLNADFSKDTVVAICNSKATYSSLFFIVNALAVDSSTFFLSGRTGTDNASNSQGSRFDMGLVKMDTNFNELNAAVFGKKDSFALEPIRSISRYEEDSFVYVGGTEGFTVNTSGYDTTTSYFMLTKADLEGNVLWTRYYTNNTYLWMSKVLATSDGGALMVGTSYNHRTANGLENDIWVVKVDKNGNMDTTTSIVENGKIPEEHFVFFPNPASDYITFRQLNVQRNYQLEMYDMQGRIIYQTQVNQSQIQIDISTYAKGAYFYRLRDEKGNLASGKLVVE